MIRAERVGSAPVIDQAMCDSLGNNINGPSLVRRPDWAPGPGRYMLYFAHHKGRHIRLAFADTVSGPWHIYAPGVLPLQETPLAQTRPDVAQPAWAAAVGEDGLYPHLASPDVHVDDQARTFEMWFHGLADEGEQVTYRAQSPDGLHWSVTGPPSAESYLRVFRHHGDVYAMARLGVLMRQRPDGTFEAGPRPIPGEIRHVAVLVRGDRLHVMFTRIGDNPERVLHTSLDLSRAWPDWPQCETVQEILRPEKSWEGADLHARPSQAGATDFAHELRDPAIFEDETGTWLIYAGGGETALGLARLSGL